MSKKPSLLSFIFGSIGGVILTLLFAKNKGKDVRGKILKKQEDGESSVGVLLQEMGSLKDEVVGATKAFLASEEIQDVMDSGKKRLHDIYEDAKGKGGKVMEDVQKQLNEYSQVAKEKAQSLGEEVKRRSGLAMEEFRENAEDIKDVGGKKLKEMKKNAGKKVDEVKERFGAGK